MKLQKPSQLITRNPLYDDSTMRYRFPNSEKEPILGNE